MTTRQAISLLSAKGKLQTYIMLSNTDLPLLISTLKKSYGFSDYLAHKVALELVNFWRIQNDRT